VNPLINCVVKTCFETAIAEARHVDKLLGLRSLPEAYSVENAPLLGVPFSCKENFQVKGMPNTAGVVARKCIVSENDSDVVKHMRRAGAILTCMTNTSEGCMWLESSNYVYGTSNNPYNLSR
jgi:fatty acid amide hydrolase 2